MARTKKLFQVNQSVLISAVVHVSVLVVLAFCGFSRIRTEGRSLTMSWRTADDEVQTMAIPQMELESAPSQEKEVQLELPTLEVQSPELFLGQQDVDAPGWSSAFTEPLPVTHTRSGSRSGRGQGEGPAGDGQAVTFFGAGAPAQKIVFVLDSSGSMTQPMSVQSRERVLKAEVMRAIRSLQEEMSFTVIYFNEKVLELDPRGLRPATAENRRAMLKWVRAVRPDGNTWPGPALERALELDPDIIFFLTDGVFHSPTVDEVTQRNKTQIPIFTIALGDPRGAAVLTRLASRNGGLYRFVP